MDASLGEGRAECSDNSSNDEKESAKTASKQMSRSGGETETSPSSNRRPRSRSVSEERKSKLKLSVPKSEVMVHHSAGGRNGGGGKKEERLRSRSHENIPSLLLNNVTLSKSRQDRDGVSDTKEVSSLDDVPKERWGKGRSVPPSFPSSASSSAPLSASPSPLSRPHTPTVRRSSKGEDRGMQEALGALASANQSLHSIGQSAMDMNDYQAMLLVQIASVFINPIEEFLQVLRRQSTYKVES